MQWTTWDICPRMIWDWEHSPSASLGVCDHSHVQLLVSKCSATPAWIAATPSWSATGLRRSTRLATTCRGVRDGVRQGPSGRGPLLRHPQNCGKSRVGGVATVTPRSATGEGGVASAPLRSNLATWTNPINATIQLDHVSCLCMSLQMLAETLYLVSQRLPLDHGRQRRWTRSR